MSADQTITTAAELDLLPVGSVVLDLGPSGSLANAPVIACKAADGKWWIGGTPKDRRWASYEVIRDADDGVLVCVHPVGAPKVAPKSDVEPTEEQAAEASCRATHPTRWEYKTTSHPCDDCTAGARAVLALLPQPATRERLDPWSDGRPARAAAAAVQKLYAAQPTVREAKAEGWDECFETTATWTPSGPNGIPHDPPTNPYRSEADR